MNKITFLFLSLLFCFSQAKANNIEKIPKISIRFENQSLESAINQLEMALDQDIKADKYDFVQFVYQDTVVGKGNIINQNFVDETIIHVLDILLANSGYSYVFFKDWFVIIYKNFDFQSKNGQYQESIKGKFVDESGKIIQHGCVCIKKEDSNIVNITEDCAYSMSNEGFILSTIPPNTYVLVAYADNNCLPQVVHIKDAAGLIKFKPNLALMDKVFRIGD